MGEVIDPLIDLDGITLEGFSQSLPTITLSPSSIHILVTTFLLPSDLNDTALHIRPCFPRMPLCYGCGSGNVCLKPFFFFQKRGTFASAALEKPRTSTADTAQYLIKMHY